MNRTKIVATIGPATATPDGIRALHKAGMSVARLNGSHADLEWHRQTVQLLRAIVPDVPILLDIPGRKVRTVLLAREPNFEIGDLIILTTDISVTDGSKVPVNYPNLHSDLKGGETILADDGTLSFCVVSVEGRDIICRANSRGTLRSRKGINVPFVSLSTPLVTDRDRSMVAFARELGVDFIGISFVESAMHVEKIRELVNGRSPQILAKVENQGGLDNVEEIVVAADAIMIDRGDLSVETMLETTSIDQKRIIQTARRYGKPVIVATEMLHSMIENNFPTKAEISDITNAVLDGCAATMLSGETAVGLHPIAAVEMMRRVADVASNHMLASRPAPPEGHEPVRQVVEDAIALILGGVPVTKVVAVTRHGYSARALSARAIRQPILAVSDNAEMARCFNLYSGVEGVHLDTAFTRSSADHVKLCLKRLYDLGKIDNSDFVLVTGAIYPRSGTRMNLIQLHRIADLADEFAWDLATPAALKA